LLNPNPNLDFYQLQMNPKDCRVASDTNVAAFSLPSIRRGCRFPRLLRILGPRYWVVWSNLDRNASLLLHRLLFQKFLAACDECHEELKAQDDKDRGGIDDSKEQRMKEIDALLPFYGSFCLQYVPESSDFETVTNLRKISLFFTSLLTGIRIYFGRELGTDASTFGHAMMGMKAMVINNHSSEAVHSRASQTPLHLT